MGGDRDGDGDATERRTRDKRDDSAADQDLCQFRTANDGVGAAAVDCPANQVRSGGAHTSVGGNTRPNDPVQRDCLADKSCKDALNADLFEARDL